MKPIANWEKVQAEKEFTPLPAGGYVCKVQGAKIREYEGKDGNSFERLEVALDICEGEFKDFYRQNFESQNTEDKKWKGVLRLYIPKNDGTEKDNWSASRFKGFIEAIENSNPGFHWDWDESKLKGKVTGIVFRSEEWEFDNRSGWKSQPYKALDVDTIRKGGFKIPKEKPLPEKTAEINSDGFVEVAIESDGDLPF